uniref:Uncharacterized protein n=1 Tax=Arundo donax TaxID=35708 RepID=A0A0A9B9I6_ARUDO
MCPSCEKSVQGLIQYKCLLSTAILITIFTKTNDAANKRNSQGYSNYMSRIIKVGVIICNNNKSADFL